jgi:hypothetical protein
MAFTRFHDDPYRINSQLKQSTGSGRYNINVPGNGDKPYYTEDPFIRMQKWGGNLMTNTINLESDLFGLTRKNNRDNTKTNDYMSQSVIANKVEYPTLNPTTDQSRTTHPAWRYKDLEQFRLDYLPLDPQENVCMSFNNNISTRIVEKNNFVDSAPCLKNMNF